MRSVSLLLGLLLAACGGSSETSQPSVEATPEPPAPASADAAADASPAAERIVLGDLRARAQPPGAPNSAVFLTLDNPGAPTALTAATGTVAQSIELHTHTADEAGVMQMRQVERIDLPTGQTRLEPGGLHIMLIGLSATLEEGQEVALGLEFADGSKADITVPVKAIQPAGMGHGGHGAHGAAPQGG